MLKLPLLFGAFLLIFGISTIGAAGSNADETFEKLASRFVDAYPALSPVGATQLGDHRFDGDLDEITAEARLREKKFYEEYLRELRRIPSGRRYSGV